MARRWRSPHDEGGKEQHSKSSALYAAITFTLLAFSAQIVGSYYTGSIALLSDTAHLFTDSFSLALSLIAVKLSGRPPSHNQSYGLYRTEVLASFMNGLLLLAVAGAIAWEATGRFFTPQEVLALPLLVVAIVGLVLNLLSAFFLHRAMGRHDHAHHHDGHAHVHAEEHRHHEDRNLHGALLHVLSDALGSVAVIIGAVVIYYTEAYWVDALIGLLLSCVIGYWAWRLMRDTTHVLLESTPKHIPIPRLLEQLKAIDERVLTVEDLHVWEITSRMYLLSVDIFVKNMPLSEADEIRKKMEDFLRKHYGIAHPTIAMKQS